MTSKDPLRLGLAPQLTRALPEVGNVQYPVEVPLLLLG